MCGELCWTFEAQFTFTALLDILIVTAVFFGISLLLRSTQAVPLLRGILIVVLFTALIATAFPLTALRWLLSNVISVAAIAIPVIFQPELRRALERLGRTNLGTRNSPELAQRHKIIDAICAAVSRLSDRRHGALIVIERETNLQEYVDSGVLMTSEISPQLLLTIFYPKTELHDGAVILRGDKVEAAAAVLPLSSGRQLTDRKLGTRHRAALGITEVGDAICVVVSEETGQISVANGGRMIRRLDAARLQTILNAFYGESESATNMVARLRNNVQRWLNRDSAPDSGT
ncbi:MAG: TIGR00159 family protein [Anaerolinea sp.]|nr:TIGR00159 family protein [Anaerolinea sp.]MCC6972438.1 TIGR00159 family protein [Anaerolineae bacterium]CAG0979697.1 Diadenylate cyclase [Anaerolineae bacterium]